MNSLNLLFCQTKVSANISVTIQASIENTYIAAYKETEISSKTKISITQMVAQNYSKINSSLGIIIINIQSHLLLPIFLA